MAFKQIKGLTVEIGGDTTELGKALESVNKKSKSLTAELSDINRLLKLDPKNTELLAQKQGVLAEAVENTAKKLDTLKEAEKQVQAQFERGDATEEQVRALRREIELTERKLSGYKSAVKETADEIADLGKKSRATADELHNIANTGFAAMTGALTAVVTGLTAATEATRAYRTEMGKLDTAFVTNGHTSAAATQTYRTLVGVLGETDQAVETANHLAVMTDNEKDLATWTNVLTGVYATFGASLPIEGLAEAANETAKTGVVTGALADALNWAGISEDAFNEQLAACSTEQERQALILSTLNGVYGEAATVYKETNADVIAANEANEAWTASLAQVGAAVEPLLTEVKAFGAELLTKTVPVIEKILDNLPVVAISIAGITAALASYKIAAIAATAAEQGLTLAQYAAAAAQKVLNATLLANPIGVVILAITALVAAFTYLWKNSESFRNFWIKLWDKIKTTVAGVVDWFKTLPDKMLSIGSDLIAGLWNGISSKFEWLKGKISGFVSSVMGSIREFFGVHSPSVKMAWIGEMLDEGLAEGLLDNAGAPIRAAGTVAGGVLDAASNGVNGMAVERSLQHRSTAAAAAASGSGMAAKLDKILEALERGQVLTIDGKQLVGGTAAMYDNTLGQRRALAARGAI